MRIDHKLDGDVLVIQPVIQTIDIANVQAFRDAVIPLLRRNPKVVVDLGHVTFIDSAGLGALISCLRVTGEHQGHMTLCGLTRAVSALFDLMRMHRVFEVHANKDSALGAVA